MQHGKRLLIGQCAASLVTRGDMRKTGGNRVRRQGMWGCGWLGRCPTLHSQVARQPLKSLARHSKLLHGAWASSTNSTHLHRSKCLNTPVLFLARGRAEGAVQLIRESTHSVDFVHSCGYGDDHTVIAQCNLIIPCLSFPRLPANMAATNVFRTRQCAGCNLWCEAHRLHQRLWPLVAGPAIAYAS